MTRLRAVSFVVVVALAGCDDTQFKFHHPGGVAVDYVDVWIAPDGELFAVGAGADGRGLVAHRDQQVWASFEFELMPTSVWGTSASDVYVGAADPADPDEVLLHWDGVTWTGLGASTGDGSRLSSVIDIFGTGSDDLWLVATREGTDIDSVLHWDGSVWTEHADVLPAPTVWSTHYLDYGCKGDPDNVWVAGNASVDGPHTDSWSYHWDGTTWTGHIIGGCGILEGFACHGDQVWAAVRDCDNDFALMYRYDGDAWTRVYNSLDEHGVGMKVWFNGVWVAENGSVWIVGGEESDGPLFEHSPAMWRMDGALLTTVARDSSKVGMLKAVVLNATGTAWAVGENGFVVETPVEPAE